MSFSWWFSKKIALGKNTKNNLSSIIIRVGQIAVALGLIVSLVTISTGVGARKAIKEKLADFNGHITIRNYNSNTSLNSDSLSLHQKFYPRFKEIPEIEHVQAIANKSGVIRTKENFSGVVFKGVGTDYDSVRFEKFMVKGHFPRINKDSIMDEVLLSKKIADEMKLDVDSSFVMYFIQEDAKPIYRRFTISGLFKTDIKNFDDQIMFGDIKHVQRLNRWDSTTVGGFELFVNDVEHIDPVAKRVQENIPYNLYAESATASFAQINDWISIFDKNIVIIVFIMLFVVIINMVMVLLILILERTHSIGILKAFGATNWRIRKLFINYALFIMLPGLIAGNAIGLGLLFVQKYFGIIKLPPENYYLSTAPVYLDFGTIVLLNAGALLVCAIVLLLPSYMISKITPAKAINFR
ncbi:ABC transporter permease [Empedobacter brevis]|uniref:Permease n=2 Tax=Empedobacter brevis TaxID=247 RepID=A0A511NG94_9FLAO|nr:FtsX-like permease family protein [Empedobacter brevis]MDM1072813.1 ABC transporter permease [Empedobacter brevis]QHC84583.1 ABC transporter permease [Empedobacter brevis]GEM51528.1 permease [Empedobacter brevis NBRC 14943 = ATCC 43319]